MSETGYSRSPKLIKGAFIHFSTPMLVPIPNLIVFQYNPETMTRTLQPWKPRERAAQVVYTDEKAAMDAAKEILNELATPFDPDETFSLTLELDATDALEEPATNQLAVLAGIADRISALELLCYPPDPNALGRLNVSVNDSLTGEATIQLGDAVPRLEVPIVLFWWGPGRILPVRVTTFSVEEQQYSPRLFPMRAKVTIGLTVLNEKHLLNIAGEVRNSAAVKLAKACYKFTQGQKVALAEASRIKKLDSFVELPL